MATLNHTNLTTYNVPALKEVSCVVLSAFLPLPLFGASNR
jgi:hypothetical protein